MRGQGMGCVSVCVFYLLIFFFLSQIIAWLWQDRVCLFFVSSFRNGITLGMSASQSKPIDHTLHVAWQDLARLHALLEPVT